jgi:hypothetical protein
MSGYQEPWELVRQLSELLDGDRGHCERSLNEWEAKLITMPTKFRDEIRRQMVLIVAGLARVEVRLTCTHGPIDTRV